MKFKIMKLWDQESKDLFLSVTENKTVKEAAAALGLTEQSVFKMKRLCKDKTLRKTSRVAFKPEIDEALTQIDKGADPEAIIASGFSAPSTLVLYAMADKDVDEVYLELSKRRSNHGTQRIRINEIYNAYLIEKEQELAHSAEINQYNILARAWA